MTQPSEHADLYREVLIKYILHVVYREGVTFIHEDPALMGSPIKFTAEQHAALLDAEAEAAKRDEAS